MALQYKIIQSSRKTDTGEMKTQSYPQLIGTRKLELDKIADIMSSRSTVGVPDVHLVVSSLTEIFPELLMQGYNLHLGQLGTFRLRARVTPSDDPNTVTHRNIKELRITFTPGKKLKEELRNAVVRKQPKSKRQM